MEFELEQTSLLVTKNKDSPKSNTSILISEYNSSQMSPIESSYLITPIHNFSNLNHPTIKKFDFNELEKPSSKKPPILKKKPIVSQITQCNQDLISKIEINLGISNHSTENSLEMLKNSTDLINKAAIEKNERNLKNNFKPLKLKLKNLDQIKKFNFPLKKKNEDFQNPFLMNKAKIMAINENFEEFFGSPNSFISQKSDINEKNKINFIFEKEFEKISILGKGNFSAVYQCKHKVSGLFFAIKVTKSTIKSVKSSLEILNEAQLLAFFSSFDDNPHIVKYYNSWFEEKELFIQMELCDASLESKAKNHNFSEKELTKILKDCCLGLKSLHKNRVVHLDIKPENILYSKEKDIYKIGDLGLSRFSYLSKGEDINEGDSRYLAQELLNINSIDMVDLTKADIFSLGASIYELMTNENLPKCGDHWQEIRKGNLKKLNLTSEYSQSFKQIIQNMMHPNFKMRPSCDEILNLENFTSDLNRELIFLKMKSDHIQEEIRKIEFCLNTTEKIKRNRKSFP